MSVIKFGSGPSITINLQYAGKLDDWIRCNAICVVVEGTSTTASEFILAGGHDSAQKFHHGHCHMRCCEPKCEKYDLMVRYLAILG